MLFSRLRRSDHILRIGRQRSFAESLELRMMLASHTCVADLEPDTSGEVIAFGDSWSFDSLYKPWHQFLAESLGREKATSDDGIYARPYATSGPPNSRGERDIGLQIDEYLSKNNPGPNDIFTFWNTATDNFEGPKSTEEVAQHYENHVRQLADAGASIFVIASQNLFGESPWSTTQNSEDIRALHNDLSRSYRDVLVESIPPLAEELNVEIAVVDVVALHEDVLERPEHYGFEVLSGVGSDVWRDYTHPAESFHALVGNLAAEQLGEPAIGTPVAGRGIGQEIYPARTNVAIFGEACHSGSRSPAALAIDGVLNTFSQTDSSIDEQWWQVDLKSPTPLDEIVIRNSVKNNTRLTDGGGLVVQVLTQDKTMVWEQEFKGTEVPDGVLSIDFGGSGVVGQIVRLSKLDPIKSGSGGRFRLREVEVYSDRAVMDGTTYRFEVDAHTGSHDQLAFDQSLVINGSALAVDLVAGVLSAGESFQLLVGDDIQGRFSTVELPSLAGGLKWDLTELYATGIVRVAAIPLSRADINSDGALDAADVDELAANMGSRHDLADMDSNGLVELSDLASVLTAAETVNGDTDLDGDVDFADFLRLSANFGTEARWSQGDLNADGSVNIDDFLVLSMNFGWSRDSELIP